MARMVAADAGRAAYMAAGNVTKKISNMTRAEILVLDDILDYSELLKYWFYLDAEEIDELIAKAKKRAENK